MDDSNRVNLGKEQSQNEQTNKDRQEQQTNWNQQFRYGPQGNWQGQPYNYQPYNGMLLTTEEKVMCAIGYFGILVLIPILAISNKKIFVKRHINCSLSILIWSIIGAFISIPIIIASVFMWFNESTIVFGMVAYFGILFLLIIYSLALCIAQIVNLVFAAIGRDAKLPILKTFTFFK